MPLRLAASAGRADLSIDLPPVNVLAAAALVFGKKQGIEKK